jgi:hypothetical protein
VDATLRQAWHGFNDNHDDQIVALPRHETSVQVGPGRAVLISGDGLVRDDSRIEVFTSTTGVIARLQASGPDYAADIGR